MTQAASPLVGIIMGSKSDWEQMSAAAEILNEFEVSHEVRVLSAHRTPDITLDYAASAVERGVPVATMAIGKSGAANAGLFTVAILALARPELGEELVKWRAARAQEVLQQKLP